MVHLTILHSAGIIYPSWLTQHADQPVQSLVGCPDFMQMDFLHSSLALKIDFWGILSKWWCNWQVHQGADQCYPRCHSSICCPVTVNSQHMHEELVWEPLANHKQPCYINHVSLLQRLVNSRLSGWRNHQWSDTLESLDSEDHLLQNMTKRVMQVLILLHLLQVPGGLAVSNFEKVEILADSLKARFQPVDDASGTVVNEIVNEAVCTYEYVCKWNEIEDSCLLGCRAV
jgi:hypothetical protein